MSDYELAAMQGNTHPPVGAPVTDPRRDTIARALYARPHLVCRCREPECPRIEAVADAVLSALPKPVDYAELGIVEDAGGGKVSVLVTRDLMRYPLPGSTVYIVREDTDAQA